MPGVWRSTIEANELGLWRATDGKLTALANVGPGQSARVHRGDVDAGGARARSPTRPAATPCASRTSGSGVHLPRIVGVRSDTFKGDDWIGLKIREASVVRGIGVLPVFAGVIGLLLLVGALAATWAREGR